ncbi:ABC transporter ATP-binding protein [Aggregatilinea lenta]|uniref:ABC transporter ATP-binding protein n=1 Tax=Aggregatilinea lenta TaxID=913108 RepID=UPI001EE973E8|nr:ABC transporter ATP-binding protein [Aggregatilinea lenta]
MADLIHIDNLSLSYDGGAVVVHELNLRIQQGTITALVGPNGCGKSTLLRGLSRLLKPASGGVYLSGRDIHAMKARDLARQLGILPQSPSAPDGLTVHELVAQGRYPHQNWFQQWSAEDERIVQDALDTTNLSMFADRPVDTLSGGQRQRAWIAMALAQQTEALLLDEPTTYLDLAYQMDVLDLLDDLNAEGRTIVMVLHDLNQAARYADTVVAMRGGQIVAQGTPEQVMTPENILHVFGLKSEVIADPVTGTPMCVPIGRRGQHKRRKPSPRSNGKVKERISVLS